jgi:Basophilic leukemia-expressed protein Bles03
MEMDYLITGLQVIDCILCDAWSTRKVSETMEQERKPVVKKDGRVFVRDLRDIPSHMPTGNDSEYWIDIKRSVGDYPERTERSGKWMVFPHVSDVDRVWSIIARATFDGQLGSSAKVATMKYNPNAIKRDEKVICIYTYDSEDRDDVLRVLKELRRLGIYNKASYKEDKATRSHQYSFNTSKQVSKYRAGYGETELLIL